MKKILSYIILVSVAFAACSREEDPVFAETADQRIQKKLAEYQVAIAGATNGWNGELTTKNNVTYRFHFSFDNANRVKMFSDFDGNTASVRKESSFRFKALQQPVLIFDTYSYIHIIGDPTDSVGGGPDGVGLNGDFEFILDTLTTDRIVMTGRFQGAKMVMKKASQQDFDAWQNGQWASATVLSDLNKRVLNYFKRLTIGTRQYEVVFDPSYRTITFTWPNGVGAPQSHTSSFNYSAQGLILDDPLVDGANTITSLSAATWNNGTTSFSLTVNNTTAGRLAGAIAPLILDAGAPLRWWESGLADYWRTNGFTVNGVPNAYKLRQLEDFYYMALLEEYDVFGSEMYDLFSYIFIGADGLELRYGLATRPPIFTGGRIIFPELGVLGDVPPEASEAFDKTAILIVNPNGFYLIQVGPDTYDMVNATDAKSFIRWSR